MRVLIVAAAAATAACGSTRESQPAISSDDIRPGPQHSTFHYYPLRRRTILRRLLLDALRARVHLNDAYLDSAIQTLTYEICAPSSSTCRQLTTLDVAQVYPLAFIDRASEVGCGYLTVRWLGRLFGGLEGVADGTAELDQMFQKAGIFGYPIYDGRAAERCSFH